MPVRLIYNPVAGEGKGLKVFKTLEPHLSEWEIEAVRTEGPKHATALAQSVAQQHDMTVISLGGDGTHHEVINGLMPNPHASFGVIPAGTGNDFVRVLSYPTDPVENLKAILTGSSQRFDVGHIADTYFLTVAGIGFDAEVAGWVNSRKKEGNGTWVFIRGILHNLFGYRSEILQSEFNGEVRQQNTFMMAIGNTPFYGGGMKICPQAFPADGQFQVIWIKRIAAWRVLPLLLRVFTGRHVERPEVTTYSTSELTVNGPERLWVHADGELLGHLPVKVTLIPSALNVKIGRLPSV